MVKIGENLRQLRLRNEQTQEQLADTLGVSPQAVSRWENETTYPDITLLPSIANYFNVTLDELFNMDELRSESKLNEIFTQVHELERNGKTSEAEILLRSAIKTYPNNYGLISELALITSNINESIELSEKVLQNSTSEKVRSTIRANLCFLYLKSGMSEKALALGNTLPHIWESREILMPNLVTDSERDDTLKDSVHIMLAMICELIHGGRPSGEYFALGETVVADNKEMLDIIESYVSRK